MPRLGLALLQGYTSKVFHSAFLAGLSPKAPARHNHGQSARLNSAVGAQGWGERSIEEHIVFSSCNSQVMPVVTPGVSHK